MSDDMPRIARLHLNEASFDPSPAVQQAIIHAAARVGQYPDATCQVLKARLADLLATTPDHVVAANGSDELLSICGQSMLGTGKRLLWASPGFPRYAKMAAAAGASPKPIPVNRHGAPDVDAILAACTSNDDVIVLASPNNPTGGAIEDGALSRLLQQRPDGALVIVDDAYHEYAMADGLADPLEILQADKGPWLLTRTFSKAYALAGLRIGYGVASDAALARQLEVNRLTFNVNTIAQAAAVAALEHPDEMRAQVASTIARRESLRSRLSTLGLTVNPSYTNFLAVDFGSQARAQQTRDALADSGILVASIDEALWNGYLRIGVGRENDHDRLLGVLQRQLGS